MSVSPAGPFSRLWQKWKSLDLPWRKWRLVGTDLSGTTFWEFKDAINTTRLRRIARYPLQVQHSDVKVSPQWHQWLRHTRNDPPSLREQQADVQRLIQLKQLAQLADERWASKASYLDAPKQNQTEPGLVSDGVRQADKSGPKENPWKTRKGGPSEKWQPEAWKAPSKSGPRTDHL